MQLKTEVHVSLDLHFTSDDLANETELARLAAITDGLALLLKAQRPKAPPALVDVPPAQLPSPEPEPVTPDATPKRARPETTLNFDEFDQLVRSEMHRLAIDGRAPGEPRWNANKCEQLPTMSSIIGRYRRECGIKSTNDLAERFGLLPALRGARAHNPPPPKRVAPPMPSPLAMQARQRIDADKAAMATPATNGNGDRGHL